jgi:hypothetical protein
MAGGRCGRQAGSGNSPSFNLWTQHLFCVRRMGAASKAQSGSWDAVEGREQLPRVKSGSFTCVYSCEGGK